LSVAVLSHGIETLKSYKAALVPLVIGGGITGVVDGLE